MFKKKTIGILASAEKNERLHVLLIDDDQAFAKIVAMSAQKMGIKVTHMSTLRQVKKQKSFQSFDGVIVDYDLDSTTGYVVVEYLHKRTETTPVIMVSSTNRPIGDKLNAALPNIKGFVTKWSSPTGFLDGVVDKLLKNNSDKNEVKIAS